MPARPRRIALVTFGFALPGGVASVARWLRDGLRSVGGYTVDVHDLATSSRDPYSRRLAAPKTWLRASLRSRSEDLDPVVHWGANAVEIETMRYRPRRELSNALAAYDLIQVVAGTPACASPVVGAGVPVVLQVATMAAWERHRQLVRETGASRIWRLSMTRLTTRIEHRALRHVDAVLVENSVMLEHVRAAGHKRVLKAPPGVDTEFFSPRATGWRRENPLLSVCRLSDERKGLERMIRAYASMLQSDDSVPPLVLAGQGRLPEPLSRLLIDLGLSTRVTVRSNPEPNDIVELYRDASVFLQTSYEEGLGISVLEAMACGLPVVCTDTAGTRETVVNGATGWLVPQESEARVSATMANRVIDVLRGDGAAMGGRGRKRCEEVFSTGTALRRFTDVYGELLRNSGPIED